MPNEMKVNGAALGYEVKGIQLSSGDVLGAGVNKRYIFWFFFFFFLISGHSIQM